MEELLNSFFGEVMLIVSVIGLVGFSFVLTVMFDDKRQHKFTLLGFIKWLREVKTDYKEPEKTETAPEQK